MELHIITACAVLSTLFLALPHYSEGKRRIVNWYRRQVVHRAHIRKLEGEDQ